MARLLGIQRAISRQPSQSLILLQDQLSEELNQILNLEEDLWAMKSRTNWLVMGERNTLYFHLSTLARRSTNRINGIQDNVGNWLFDAEEVKVHFVEGFKNIYQTEQIQCDLKLEPLPSWGALLSQEDAISLAKPFSELEIFAALQSMKPFKALGPDGLHAGFFQKCWKVVGASVTKAILDISILVPCLPSLIKLL